MKPISLTLNESAGIARKCWPITRGIPLPEGVIHDPNVLRLFAADEIVSSQFRVLSRWPDGSIQWVLVDGQIDVGAHGTVWLCVRTAAEEIPTPEEPVETTETDEAVIVCTGPLRFTIRRDRVGLCESLQLGRRADGSFAPDIDLSPDGIELWARIAEGASSGGTRRRIYGMGGTCLARLAPDAWSVQIQESGPLRTVITCRAALELDAPMHHYAGYRPLQVIVRIHAYAGQPFLRILHTTVMSHDPRQVQVEALGLRWSLPEVKTLHCRYDAGAPTQLARGGAVHLAQVDDVTAHVETRGSSDSKTIDVERLDGWFTAEHTGDGLPWVLGVALRHMAEEGPKALQASVGPEGQAFIDALVYDHPDGKPLDLSRYAEEVAWHEGEGVWSDGTGTAKTSELFVLGIDANTVAAESCLRALLTQPPVRIEPDHLANCAATGGFEPAGDLFPASDRLLADLVGWLHRQIQNGRWFGFLDWGDVLIAFEESAQTWRYQGRWGWCNSEWDPRHGVWIQYMRTGDPALFDLAEAMTRHSVDVDTCHWHAYRPYFVGGCFRHSVSHFSDEPCASHTFLDNWIDYYHLTGDLRTLEVIREAGQFFLRYRWTEDPRFSFSLRSIGNVLRGLLYVYQVTGEEVYRKRADEVFEMIARGQCEDGSWLKRFQVSTSDRRPAQLPYGMATEGTTLAVELGAPPFTDEEHRGLSGTDTPICREIPFGELKGYQTHYLLIGIELLHRMTGRADVAEVYQRAVDWFMEAHHTRHHYGGILCRHLAYAWRLTGSRAYLDTGIDVLRQLMTMQDRSDDPRRRGAILMSPMYVSLVYFGVPFFLRALREADMDEPTAP